MILKNTLFFCSLLFMLHAPFLLTAQNSQSKTNTSEDKVTTLETSTELTAYGNLGGITVDRLGFIYVANFAESVWRIAPDGEVKLLSDGLYGGSGNAVDKEGNLYQANFFGNTILKIDRLGNVNIHARQLLNGPVGMIFDDQENLMVCNCADNKILKISPRMGSEVFAEGELFNCPNGITKDSEGNFYIVNFNNDHVIKLTKSGEISRFATIGSAEGNAHIVYVNNYFYVTKIKSNSLYKVDPEGNATLIAGSFQPGHDDGPASKASFNKPNGITASPNGKTLFINTLIGEWASGKPSSITVRKVELVTLPGIFDAALNSDGMDAAVIAYGQYKDDPARKFEDTFAGMASLGWQYLSSGKFAEATKVFTLNAESYPDRWRSHYNLGELYKIFQQNELSVQHYEKALKLSPGNPSVSAKLKELKGE